MPRRRSIRFKLGTTASRGLVETHRPRRLPVMARLVRMGVKIAAPVATVSWPAGPGHPRLAVLKQAKSWRADTRPAMTRVERQCRRSRYFNAYAACPGHDDPGDWPSVRGTSQLICGLL